MRRPEFPGLKEIWHKGITNSMSIFIWRLLSNRVPVDAKLQWRKIDLASKCICCEVSPSIETLSHLFISGEGATEVWRTFNSWFVGQDYPLRESDSIPSRLEVWSNRIIQLKKMHLSRILPCLIFWFLWAERNNSRHNEIKFRGSNVIWQVQMHIQRLINKGILGEKNWRGCTTNALRRVRVEDRGITPRPRIIEWRPPETA